MDDDPVVVHLEDQEDTEDVRAKGQVINAMGMLASLFLIFVLI